MRGKRFRAAAGRCDAGKIFRKLDNSVGGHPPLVRRK
jgi:hypothetical protein